MTRNSRMPTLAVEPVADDSVVIRLPAGDNADSLAAARLGVLEAVMAGRRTVVLDLGDGPSLTSNVVALLITCHRLCRGRNRRLVIRGVSLPARTVIENSRLHFLLEIEDP